MNKNLPDFMPVLMMGLNYKVAPVEVREQFAFHPERVPLALHELIKDKGAIKEAVLLSTCNRTETYVSVGDFAQAEVQQTLRRMGSLTPHQEKLVHALGKAIAGKLLHQPTLCLRELPVNEDATSYIEMVQDLYGLQ